MENIIEVRGFRPITGNSCFIAPGAFLIGDIVCGDDCSFWFNAVVRGDVNSIRMGNKVNVQDGAVIHATMNKTKTIMEGCWHSSGFHYMTSTTNLIPLNGYVSMKV